jgi:hypothetical protein
MGGLLGLLPSLFGGGQQQQQGGGAGSTIMNTLSGGLSGAALGPLGMLGGAAMGLLPSLFGGGK